jgi:hypothetical protein
VSREVNDGTRLFIFWTYAHVTVVRCPCFPLKDS